MSTSTTINLTPTFSVYLDWCRFFAAVIVVLAHFVQWEIVSPELSQWLPESGRDAVVVFFVLSGLVIYYTVHKKNSSIRSYLIDRATRIYSVALPILLLTVIVDLIGIRFNSEPYLGLYQYEKLYIYIPFHLAFAGEWWTLSEQPFTVPPYWSLSYEVWYYILFIPLHFYRGVKRWLLFAALMLLVGYKLWLLYPVWLSGVWLMKNIERLAMKKRTARIVFWLPLLAYLLYKAANIDAVLLTLMHDLWPWESLPLGSAQNVLSDYVIGLLTLCHLIGARYYIGMINDSLANGIRIAASYTFTLYLIHAPVLKTLEYHFDYNKNSMVSFLLILLLVAFFTITIGNVTERKKHWYKKPVDLIFQCFEVLFKKLNFAK